MAKKPANRKPEAKPERARRSSASRGLRNVARGAAEFDWTSARVEAAERLAEDVLSDDQIAARVGVTRKTIYEWKSIPAFAARIKEIVAKTTERATKFGIASIVNRVRMLDNLWGRLYQVVLERAEAPENEKAAGGKTGTIVKQLKAIGHGKEFRMVEEFSVDVALIREMRSLQQDAAKELGQLVDKLALTTPDGVEEYGQKIITPDERKLLYAAIMARLGMEDDQAPGGRAGIPAGSPLARLNADHEGGGDGAGPVADEGLKRLKPPSAVAVFASDRKVSDGRGDGR